MNSEQLRDFLTRTSKSVRKSTCSTGKSQNFVNFSSTNLVRKLESQVEKPGKTSQSSEKSVKIQKML